MHTQTPNNSLLLRFH